MYRLDMIIKIAPLFAVFVICFLAVTIETKEVGDDYPIRESDVDWLNSLFYIPREPRVRREYRMLSDEERYQFNDAFVKMKNDRSVVPNKYDLFSSIHARRSTRNSAHRGTGFLGWHRVYTLLMENAIREWYPNITMAYWDTTLDAVLDLPRESSLWSEDFMGNGDGYVQKGVFKGWGTQNGELYRTVGALYGPLADKNISFLLEHDHIGNISYPMRGKNVENVYEEIHNRVHHFVGGEMKVIETAADDPVFFPYHSFVSYIWEDFRTLQRMRGIDPEIDWDEHYGPARHHKYSSMGIGNLMAIDGSSDLFAENIVFADRPSCSREFPDCGTPHLYCNVTVEKCCPWTVGEYNIVKKAAKDNNIPFSEAVIPFIESKVNKGFWQVSKLSNDSSLEEYGNPFPEEEDYFVKMGDKYAETVPDTDNEQNEDDIMENYLDFFDDFEQHFSNEGNDHFHSDEGNDHYHSDKGNDHYHSDDGNDHFHSVEKNDNSSSDDDNSDGEDYSLGDYSLTGHSHGGHSHGGQSHGGHSSDGHAHSHNNVIKARKQMHYVAAMENIFPLYFALVALAVLTGLRVLIVIVTKCIAENRNKRSSQRKYRIDGIVNANFSDDENKKKQSNTLVNRRNNIYTVTVTKNNQHLPEHNGTFVRFEKYTIEKSCTDVSVQRSTDRQASTASDYLDMTYASHNNKVDTDEQGKRSDMFEHEDSTVADFEVEEIDRSYNSIENENFEISCKVEIEADGQKSEEIFDEFDTYDNIMFKREAVGSGAEETTNGVGEGFYENYLPGTRL